MKPRGVGAIVAASLLSSTACEFGEIAIPEGDPIVVVHAIMRPDLGRQWVLVEQTLTGSELVEDTEGAIPGTPPHLPVTGATVTVTNLSDTNDPCGTTSFTESPNDPGLQTALGLYWGPADCPAMRTGDTLELRVETVDGSLVTGRMEVAGVDAMVLRAGVDSVMLPGPQLLFNRDTDTLDAQVMGASGRALQVEVSRFDSLNSIEPVFWMVLDTTEMTIPGRMIDFFDELFDDDDTTSSDSPGHVFTAGRYHAVTVAYLDDRYFDFMRSANMELSGRGFINNLEGGMGVFGSVVALTNDMKVVGNLDDDREGSYRMVGDVQGTAVDVSLELYVAVMGEDTTAVAAFADGDWLFGNIHTSVDGFFHGRTVEFTFFQVDPTNPDSLSAIVLSGSTGSGNSFAMGAFDRQLQNVGTVTVTKNDP